MDEIKNASAAGFYELKMIAAIQHLHPSPPDLPLPALKRGRAFNLQGVQFKHMDTLNDILKNKNKTSTNNAAALLRQIHPPWLSVTEP